MNSLLNTDNFYHYYIVANSQNFNLTADRNNISNIDDVAVKWVINQIIDVINTQIKPIADREYFMMIKSEEEEYEIKNKCDKTKKSIKKAIKSQDIGINELAMSKVPRNELETSLLFCSILSNLDLCKFLPDISHILSYSNKTPTDMICLGKKCENILVEVELKLSNFIKHKHTIETVDYIVCWNIDLEENRIYKVNDNSCIFINNDERKYLTFDEKELEVIELKSIVKRIITATKAVGY